MTRPLPAPGSRLWFHGILIVNAVLLLVTFFRLELAEAGGLLVKLRQLSLSGENNIASWWSGVLLALIGVHAYDGYALNRRANPRLARAWAALAVILLVLSADEIGSLHERADRLIHRETWLSLLPFAIVGLGPVGYALGVLWSVPGRRPTAVLVSLGFLCLSLVVAQEFLEHRMMWEGWRKAIRGAAEEGCEIAGFMLFLRASMANTQGILGRAAEAGGRAVAAPAFELICSLRKWLVAGGLLLGLLLAPVTASLTDTGRGRPADWPAAVLFAFAALAAVLDFLRSGRVPRIREGLRAALALFASVAVVALSPRHTLHLPFLTGLLSLRAVVVAAAALGALATELPGGRPRRRQVAAVAAALLIGAAGASFPSGPMSHATLVLLAAIVYDDCARTACERQA